MLHATAGWVADRDRLPTALRAVLGYYADTGVFDHRSLRLRRRVDAVSDRMVADAFAAVEAAAGRRLDATVTFDYDTKLVLPAELTLGYLYRRADDDETAEAVTRLVVEALIDGDVRDAINDDEYGDFRVTVDGRPATDGQRRAVAECAQDRLQSRVERRFEGYSEEVRAAYDRAVETSERHQAEDPLFRELMTEARESGAEARERIRARYREAAFEEPPGLFTPAERELPYLRTQYDRVGVIYEGMIGMYRAAGLPVSRAFERSVVLAIIGAQVWLDDVDDFAADMREGQLTPVTAEYLLAAGDWGGYHRVRSLARAYLDSARAAATAADSPLTGIATEYIYRDGDPGVLPDGTRS